MSPPGTEEAGPASPAPRIGHHHSDVIEVEFSAADRAHAAAADSFSAIALADMLREHAAVCL